jgi:hypothetical protein
MEQIALLAHEKRCSRCKRWLPIDQFRARVMRGRPYVEARCRLCIANAVSKYAGTHRRTIRRTRKKWYAKNRARLIAYGKARYCNMHRERRDFIEWIKSAPCRDCGATFPYVCMDFDHCRGEKLTDVSKMQFGKFTNEEVMTELGKCELVCANCHRIRTATRRRERGT